MSWRPYPAAMALCLLVFVTFLVSVSSPTVAPLLVSRRRPCKSNHTQDSQGQDYAFATFLSTKVPDKEVDPYFEATRTLLYQLKHQPETRSALPVLVLCTPVVSARKRRRLRLEGAQVMVVPFLVETTSWLRLGHARWADQMTKVTTVLPCATAEITAVSDHL